jgi:hypothetical protein
MSSGQDAKQTVEVPCVRVSTINPDTSRVESEWVIIHALSADVETELMEAMYFGRPE